MYTEAVRAHMLQLGSEYVSLGVGSHKGLFEVWILYDQRLRLTEYRISWYFIFVPITERTRQDLGSEYPYERLWEVIVPLWDRQSVNCLTRTKAIFHSETTIRIPLGHSRELAVVRLVGIRTA